MLRFHVYDGAQPAKHVPTDGAYLVGTDHVPVRTDFEFRKGELICHKRAQGPAGLACMWPVKDFGRVMLETTRLPERERPYNLHLELARGQMMRLQHKREDWGLFDVENIEQISRECTKAQDLFIEAIKSGNVATAARLADQVLGIALPLGEQMALFHASVFLNRRRHAQQFGNHLFGCSVNPTTNADLYRKRLQNGFDFVTLPIPWRLLEPKQGELNWEPIDEWVQWLGSQRLPIKATPLVSFAEEDIPDWLYIYEHDFEAVRDLVYEHIRRVVQRYSQQIHAWDAISGIHARNAFNFNFEQLMELTRVSSAITKQLAPRAVTLIDLVAPWGEYYSRNPRTIPPLLYADMIIQNGINFDALGLQIFTGLGIDGMYVRDMFQMSCMLDRFASFGKPVHITAVGVPSNNAADDSDAWAGKHITDNGGMWYDKWSEPLQSRWLREFYNIALSKPFIDTIAWRDLADQATHYLPHGGLLRTDLSPKLAYEQHCTIRAQIHGNGQPKKNS